MTDPAARCVASVFDRLGKPGWWLDQESSGRVAVQVLVKHPGLNALAGRAASAMPQRFVTLPPAAAGAVPGDLVAFDGECWLLTGRPDPDPRGMAQGWIAMPFTPVPAFDGSSCPVLVHNGVAWVAPS
ncbi:MAG: hypothetical protein WAS21_10465 [Geminicoccaceae bacterium]